MTGADAKPRSVQAIRTRYPDLANKLPPLGTALEAGTGISYTQWEAWLALYHGKALLIAKADDAAPRGPSYIPPKLPAQRNRPIWRGSERSDAIRAVPSPARTSSPNTSSLGNPRICWLKAHGLDLTF